MTPSTQHPDARLGRIYTAAFQSAYRIGMSHADAREHAAREVERAKRGGGR